MARCTFEADPRARRVLGPMAVGPCMVVVETLLCGHFLEGVKVRRQVTGLPYAVVARDALRAGWLRGYFPWGLGQAATKGLPVLATQRACEDALLPPAPADGSAAPGRAAAVVLSGAAAGVAQAVVVTPTQRLKTVAWIQGAGVRAVIRRPATLFAGVTPMALRRAVDWGIRVGVVRGGGEPGDRSLGHQVGTCLAAAALSSSVSMPFDNLVARTQAEPASQKSRGGLLRCAREIVAAEGLRHGLYRGWLVRLLDSGHHTFWVLVAGGAILRGLG